MVGRSPAGCPQCRAPGEYLQLLVVVVHLLNTRFREGHKFCGYKHEVLTLKSNIAELANKNTMMSVSVLSLSRLITLSTGAGVDLPL